MAQPVDDKTLEVRAPRGGQDGGNWFVTNFFARFITEEPINPAFCIIVCTKTMRKHSQLTRWWDCEHDWVMQSTFSWQEIDLMIVEARGIIVK